jgi:hypothetical protein
MRRAAVCVVFLMAGILTSWLSLTIASRLAVRFSWPLFDTRWHGCWDAERCGNSWLGNVMITVSIIGPALVWATAGYWQAGERASLRLAARALLMAVATLMFYLMLYVAVWP